MKSENIEMIINETCPLRVTWWPLVFLLICFLCHAGEEAAMAQGGGTVANPVASLKAKYVSLQNELYHNPYQRPLYMDSSENSRNLMGEIYAELEYPFIMLSGVLKEVHPWCDILSLHLNIKYCQAQTEKQHRELSLYIGRKTEQSLERASHVVLTFHADTKMPDYLQVNLNADMGPFDTRNYHIFLEAIPVKDGRSFIRLSYSYESSLAATLAMKCYLSAFGSHKVGFTIVGRKPDGSPIYTGDVRGVVERNTMRYYLAIDAYLNALAVPPGQRLETRLQNWFTATERYPLQLREMERGEYLAMKYKEYQRQKESPSTRHYFSE